RRGRGSSRAAREDDRALRHRPPRRDAAGYRRLRRVPTHPRQAGDPYRDAHRPGRRHRPRRGPRTGRRRLRPEALQPARAPGSHARRPAARAARAAAAVGAGRVARPHRGRRPDGRRSRAQGHPRWPRARAHVVRVPGPRRPRTPRRRVRHARGARECCAPAPRARRCAVRPERRSLARRPRLASPPEARRRPARAEADPYGPRHRLHPGPPLVILAAERGRALVKGVSGSSRGRQDGTMRRPHSLRSRLFRWFFGAILLAMLTSALVVSTTRPESITGAEALAHNVADRLAQNWDDPEATRAFVAEVRDVTGFDVRLVRDPRRLPLHVRRVAERGGAIAPDGPEHIFV